MITNNPLFNTQTQNGNTLTPTPSNTPTFLDYVSNIQNPRAFAQNMLQQNPAARQFITQLQNSTNGMSPKQAVYQLASQRGIPHEQIDQVARQMGLKN